MSDLPTREHFENAYRNKAPWDIPGPQPEFVRIADQVRGSVLDAGCGTGENALFFAARGNAVTGIDYVEEPIRRAKLKAAERGLSANFLVMSALAIEQIPQQYDNVIDSGLFHTFNDEDRRTYVRNLAENLKPGGRLLLMCFSDVEPGTFGPRRVSESELRAAFSSGWTIESLAATQFQVIPEFAAQFSAGGPKAWLLTVRRD